MRQRALHAGMAAIIFQLVARLFFRPAHHHGGELKHQYLRRVTSALTRLGTDIGHRRGEIGRCQFGEEHAFGMFRGELPPPRRRPGLVQDRRALRRRFAQM